MLIQFILVLIYEVVSRVFGWSFPMRVEMFFHNLIDKGIDPLFSAMYTIPFIPWVSLLAVIGSIVAIYIGLFLIKLIMLVVGLVKGIFAR